MTIPSTASRKIVVGEAEYRWTVRDRPTYSQDIAESHLTVAVESSQPLGQTLHLTLPAVRCDNWLAQPGYVVTPADVARWISLAISLGWAPTEPGSTFQLSLAKADLDAKRIRWPNAG